MCPRTRTSPITFSEPVNARLAVVLDQLSAGRDRAAVHAQRRPDDVHAGPGERPAGRCVVRRHRHRAAGHRCRRDRSTERDVGWRELLASQPASQPIPARARSRRSRDPGQRPRGRDHREPSRRKASSWVTSTARPAPASRASICRTPTGDGDAATSDGIFVFTGDATNVATGDLVRVTGFARERFNQTAINGDANSDHACRLIEHRDLRRG